MSMSVFVASFEKHLGYLLAENTANFHGWSFPDEATLKADFDEYKLKEKAKWEARAKTIGAHFPIFTDLQDFTERCKSAKVVEVTTSFASRVQNLTQLSSIEDIKQMVGHYAYPRDVDRIVQGFETNARMPYPIILKGNRGMWIMAGNTRLNVANALGVIQKALVADVSI